ncbi:hypothetical protein [Aurantiacibacter sp. MUD61]|uniref:hypothetical protein n=1 Tax=Aurantiacibacter sp. MUD61 TaxID=3009083 RepID=UPI0022F046E1|nr:hypothetical protein [Aurantiacibacter sp. MUD61]
MRHFALLALPLMLAACNGDAPGGDGEALAPEGPEPLENATLDLQATGIIIPPQAGFEQLEVPFGSMREATETTLANIVGDVVGENSENDCGLTSTSFEGLTLNFRDDQFVGYTANAPYVPELSREEMLADPQVSMMEDSTIDGEFMIGTDPENSIGGVFVDDEVRALYAGENCIAR